MFTCHSKVATVVVDEILQDQERLSWLAALDLLRLSLEASIGLSRPMLLQRLELVFQELVHHTVAFASPCSVDLVITAAS